MREYQNNTSIAGFFDQEGKKRVKNIQLIFVIIYAISTTGCSSLNLLIGHTPQPTKPPQPDQEAIDAMVQFWSGGSTLEKMKVSDFAILHLSDADIANGIEKRVCITLGYIKKNENGIWEDWSISLPMDKLSGKWQLNQSIREDFDKSSGHLYNFGNLLLLTTTGNCDWARERFGVETTP